MPTNSAAAVLAVKIGQDENDPETTDETQELSLLAAAPELPKAARLTDGLATGLESIAAGWASILLSPAGLPR